MMSPDYLDHYQQLERAIAVHQGSGIAESYQAQLVLPAAHTLEIERFLEWERRKMKEFYESNEEFCRYKQAGDTSRDEDWIYSLTINQNCGLEA